MCAGNLKLIEHACKISHKTAVDWTNLVRDIFVEKFLKEEIVIGGFAKQVQIDETHVVNRKYHRGRELATQVWIFGGVDEDGTVFMKVVEKREKTTLHDLIKKHIAPGSSIVSEDWKAYSGLEQYGYSRSVVCYKKEFVNADGDHTNQIESFWGAFKIYSISDIFLFILKCTTYYPR